MRSMGVKDYTPSVDRRQAWRRDGRAGRRWKRILSPILITVAIASCDGDAVTRTPAALRFGYDYWPGYYPVLIAAEKGYFAEEDSPSKPRNVTTPTP